MLSMTRWLSWMLWPTSWQQDISPHWWHAHEMLFGFAMPVVAGFLLTAVATWTDTPGTRGWRLKVLFVLWLAARLLLWLFPQWLLQAWLAEMLFFMLLMLELGQRVWAKRQWRNMLFLPVLLALALFDSASYWNVDEPVTSARLHYGAVWMITTLVVIVGGRVIPLFTANRLGLEIAPLPTWFEYLAIGSVILIGLVTAIWPWRQLSPWAELLLLSACATHLYRLGHWQGWMTLRTPLLWSMHLSYLCIPLTMLGLVLSGSDPVTSKNMIHLLAIGAIGGMIIAMMSRVSLGHTGRPLDVPTYIATAFALVILAALIRAVLPIVAVSLTSMAWRFSAGLWILAFGGFIYRYLPILTRPRVDGKPG